VPRQRRFRDLLDVLEHQASSSNSKLQFISLDQGSHVVDLASIVVQAQRLASTMLSFQPPLEPYAIVIAPNRVEFAIAFFAVLYSGLVPVPGPSLPLSHPAHRSRLLKIAEDCNAEVVITVDEMRQGLIDLMPRALVLTPSDSLLTCKDDNRRPADVAFLQYTSGSTGTPKRITVRSCNVLAQLGQAATAYREDQRSVSVNWVPLYHDMGLVTSLLRPVYGGYDSVILEPYDFIREPMSWIRALSRFRGTHTSSPNFGYQLCATKGVSESGLDLRSLIVARNAGEMVRMDTMRNFTERFGPVGFRFEAFSPSYGLAEATLTVTTVPVAVAPKAIEADASALREGFVRPGIEGASVTSVVSCGNPLPRTSVAIVDQADRAVGERVVGDISIAGPQVSSVGAYVWSRGTRSGRRTGDHGFMLDGELYVVGRASERFSSRGETFYASVTEKVLASADPRLRPGRLVIFVHASDRTQPELVVLAEIRRDAEQQLPVDLHYICARIVARAAADIGLRADVVQLLAQGVLPVTTSGKLQRARAAQAFADGIRPVLFTWRRSTGASS